ncbi:MAG: MBL fold metallo-hydrolase [Betaproteobacteria bacterium]|nr:MBL fold metallo-hydrolase [Betaproteobacteria bacterium]
MNLIPLPAFSDNYIWLIQHQGRALVVDPGQAEPVTRWLTEHQLSLDCILVTHHHGDHTGGVASLQQQWGAKVYGPASESLPFEYQPLRQGDSVHWGDLVFQILDVPGHTSGHIAYWTQPSTQDPILFCGDTLFSGGCGRIFEGTPCVLGKTISNDKLLSQSFDSRLVCCIFKLDAFRLRKLKQNKRRENGHHTSQS